jgi:UMF1 family MFS transporter
MDLTRAHRGFAGYDWANSGYVTVVTTAVGGPYLDALAKGSSQSALVLPLTLVLAVVAQVVVLPAIGRRVDRGAEPAPLIRRFALLGGLSTLVVALAPHWAVASLGLATATVCFGAAMVPYNALLPRLAPGSDADRLSSRAFATGYLGGGLLLAGALGLLSVVGSQALGVRVAIAAAGLWWAGFALLACRAMATAPALPTPAEERIGALRLLRDLPQLRTAILGALLLGDAIGAVVSLSATVLTHELWTAHGRPASAATSTLLAMVLLVQVLAAPAAYATGKLAARVGTKPVLLGCIAGWVVVMVGATTSLHQVTDVWFLAVGLAAVLGGSQTLSRSLISQLSPAGNAGAVFSITQLAERGTAWMGPTLFAIVVGTTGSYRGALGSLVVMFVVAALLLTRVRPACGIAEASSYNASLAYQARRLALPDAKVPTRRGRAA